MICTFLFVHNRPCATYRILPSNSRMPNQAQDFEGAVSDSSSTIYRSNFFWKCSLRCSLLSEQNFSCRIKGVFFIESPFSVHLVVIWVTSVYFQSAKFRTFQIFHAKYGKTFKINLKRFCRNGTIILSFYGNSAQSPVRTGRKRRSSCGMCKNR